MNRNILAIVLVLFAAGAAHAEVNPWGVIGAGCIPAGPTVAMGFQTDSSTGAVRFVPGSTTTGVLRFFCPVFGFDRSDDITKFHAYYSDPDGTGTNYRVRVYLFTRQQDPGVSGVISPRTELCHTDSNLFPNTGIRATTCTLAAPWVVGTVDVYWFEVVLERSSTANTPEFFGVSLYL
jgi:hypothetical protein